MKNFLLSIGVLLFLLPSCFADSLPVFPMTIYGTISGVGIGTKLSFYDGSNSLMGSYITIRDGWYGYDNSINGSSPTFPSFTGSLKISIEYQNKTYSISSITGSIIGCPISNNLIFVSAVCRYDIVTVAPVVVSSSSSSVGGGSSSSYVAPLPIATVVSNTGSTQSGIISTPIIGSTSKIVNEATSKNPITITPQELKKSKTITLVTVFKKGTNLTIYRVLPNGRQLKTGVTRVLPNGKIRFNSKVAGKYIFISK